MAGDVLRFVIEVDEATATARLTRFRQGLEQTGQAAVTASQKTGQAVGDVQNRLTAFGSTATQIGRTLSLALTAPILAVGGFGIAFNSMQEQAQIAFTNILKSSSAATAMISQLKDFAARTPFQFPELVQATQRLIAMGVEASKTHEVLVAIGDAAAAMGGGAEKVAVLTHAIGQMAATGRVTGRETMELAMAGVNAYKILAEGYHTTVEDIRKRTEKGMIDSRTAIDIIVRGIEQQFAGMMQQQSRTFAGLLSTIADESRFLAGSLTEGLFNALKGPAAAAIDILHELRLAVEAMPDSIKATVAGFAIFLAAIGPGLFLIGQLAGSIRNLIALWTLYKEAQIAATATTAVGGLAGAGMGMGVTVAEAGAMTMLGAAAVGVAESLAVVAAVLGTLYIAKRTSDVTGFTDALKDAGSEALRLAVNIGRVVASMDDFKDRAKGAPRDLSGLLGFAGAQTMATLRSPIGAMRETNEFLESIGQPPPPLAASGNMPAGARAALAANEAAMRAGIPKAINVPGFDDASKLLEQQVDNIVRQVMREENESKALDLALQKLTAAHVPLLVIADKLGKQIKDNAEVVGMLGGKISEARQRVLDFVTLQETMTRGNKAVSDSIDHSDGKWLDMIDAIVQATEGVAIWDNRVGMLVGGIDAEAAAIIAANDAMEQHGKLLHQMGEDLLFLKDAGEAVRQLLRDQPGPGFILGGVDTSGNARRQAIAGGLVDVNKGIGQQQELPHVVAGILEAVKSSNPENLVLAYREMHDQISSVEDILKTYNITLTQEEKATLAAAIAHNKAAEDAKQFEIAFGVAMGQMFADLVTGIVKAAGSAKNFKSSMQAAIDTAISGFGEKLGEMIALALSRPLLERFERLGERLAKIFDKVGDKIGDVIGKALGDKIGKSIGGLVGDLAGGAIGAAIGAVVGAVAGAVGKGRRTANEFVQGSQNAFGNQLGNAVNDFWKQVGAGTLSKSEGMSARNEVLQMWTDFQQSAMEFAAKGGTEAKVAMQALETLSPIVAANLRDMDNAIEGLGSTAKKTALEFEQAVAAMLSSITSFADNADVLEEAIHRAIDKGIPMNLIIDTLGNTVTATVKQLTALGIEVPPYIKLVSDAIDALGNSAETAATKLKNGLSVEDFVKAEIAAYNAGFEVGRVTRSANAYRYVTPPVPTTSRVAVEDRPPASADAMPAINVYITEGDISVMQEAGMSADEVLAKFRDDVANNRRNTKTFLAKAVKDAWKAEGRRF